MADLNAKILPLRTSEPARVPDDATMDLLGVPRLDIGEIAVNLHDKKIYSKNEAGEIVTLGAGAEEEGDGLPGGGFKPNTYEPDEILDSVYRFNVRGTGNAYGWSYSPGVQFDTNSSSYDRDGNSFNVRPYYQQMVSDGADRIYVATEDPWQGDEVTWTELTFTSTQFSTVQPYNYFFGVPTDAASLADPSLTEIWVSFFIPGEPVPIELAEGDALRYDGEFWRPVKYRIEGLDDVEIANGTGSGLVIQWQQQVTASQSGGMDPGESYQDADNNGLHPQAYVNDTLVDISEEFEAWITQKSGVDVSTDRDGGDWNLSFETVLRHNGNDYPVNVFRFRNRSLSTSNYDPRFSMHYTRPTGVADSSGIMRFPEFEQFYAVSQGATYQGVEDGSVLQYKKDTGKWTTGILSFLLQQAGDFAYRQALPLTPSWTDGDSANPAEYQTDGTSWVFNLQAAGGADRSQFFTDFSDSTAVWWSTDGTAFTQDETVTSITQDGTTATITFETAVPQSPTTLFIAFNEPGVLVDQPIRTGEILVFNGTSFEPADPGTTLALGITNLSDVNTVTNPPTDGQALVWDAANNVWKPGNVASENDAALDDLTDVTVSSPASGQVVKYTGSGFENSALDYSEIENAPAAINTLGDISDVDLSLAPVIGQVLVWDGSAWKPEDQTGGGGGGGTVAGALSERADITSGITLNPGAQGDLELQGLGEAGSFVQVTVNVPAWVRFYPTAGARAGDATRQVDEDPAPGSGVLLEVRTETADETLIISPGAIYYNNDTLPDQTLYARIQNQGGDTALVNVTVRAYTQTSTDTISGGTFGSG